MTRRRRRAAIAVLSVGLFAGALAACTGAPAPTGETPTAFRAGINLLVLGDRTATVHVPRHTSGAVPLVLVLHELSGSGAVAMTYGFEPLVDSKGFVAVYPDGIDGSWNAGSCCGDAASRDTDDVAFLTSVVRMVESRTKVDPKRVYVTGFSNGAMMSYRLGCDTKLFAAIAPMSGDVMTGCDHPAPASVLEVHGLADTVVPYDEAADDPWRTADRCGPPVATQAGVMHASEADCADGRSVQVLTIDGMPHQVATSADGLDAAAEIWSFFATHPGR
jgi:polyhydroxybutyrate depolymerase